MEKTISLNESHIRRLVSLVLEQDEDTYGYDEFDYIDAFNRVFSNWLSTTQNIDVSKYPLSYLLKKYSARFLLAHKLMPEEDVDEDYVIDRWSMPNIGKDILQKGLIKYPSLREEGRFLERFGKAIERFISSQNYPTYVNVNMEENRPYQIETNYEIDLISSLKSDDEQKFYKHKLNKNFEDFIQNYLGMEITSSQYGGVEVKRPNIVLKGKDEFIKNVINKEIKKKIREISNNTIQRMNLEFEEGPKLNLKLIFKYGPSWEKKSEIVDKASQILKKMGFNADKFKVSRG